MNLENQQQALNSESQLKNFEINKECLQKFIDQTQTLSQYTNEEIKKYVNDAVEKQDQQTDQFKCCICTQFAHEPNVCMKCEVAVTCKDCYLQWKDKCNGKDHCPLCNTEDSEPKPMMRFAISMRDSIIVTCKKNDCPKNQQEMNFSDYIKHIGQCLKKQYECPLNCGLQLNSQQDSKTHYNQCLNSIHDCNICFSQSLLKDINNHNCIQELKKQNEQEQMKYKIEQEKLENKILEQQKVIQEQQEWIQIQTQKMQNFEEQKYEFVQKNEEQKCPMCPSLHQLQEKKQSAIKNLTQSIFKSLVCNQCNFCHKQNIQRGTFYRCEKCDFDLCEECYIKFQQNIDKDQ